MPWGGNYWDVGDRAFKQGIMEQSSEATCPIGTVRFLSNGNVYVYSQAGASDLGAGLFNTYITTFSTAAVAPTAHPAGTRVITATLSGVTADQYAGGKLVISAGAGIGETYDIVTNTATSGTTFTATLADPTATLWSASTTYLRFCENPYKALVVNPVDSQQRPVVVTPRPVTATYYFWGLARGYIGMQCDVNAAGGLELDEKILSASVTHAGFALPGASPSVRSMNAEFGHVIEEADITDNTATLCWINLL